MVSREFSAESTGIVKVHWDANLWICFVTDNTNKRVVRWAMTTQSGRRPLHLRWEAQHKAAGGEGYVRFSDLEFINDEGCAWRALDMLATWDWPPAAVRAIVDAAFTTAGQK